MERSRRGRDYVLNLFKTHGGLSDDDARNRVEISSATFPARWPDTFETAQTATHEIRASVVAALGADFSTESVAVSHQTGSRIAAQSRAPLRRRKMRSPVQPPPWMSSISHVCVE